MTNTATLRAARHHVHPLATAVAASLLAHAAGYVLISRVKAHRPVAPVEFVVLEEAPRRAEPPPIAVEAPTAGAAGAGANDAHAAPPRRVDAARPRSSGPPPAAPSTADVARAVGGQGLLKALRSLQGGPDAVGPAPDDRGRLALAPGSDPVAPAAGAGRKGGGGGGAASIGTLATGGIGQGGEGIGGTGVGSGAGGLGSVGTGTAAIDSGEVEPARLATFVRARMASIKACYESQLRVDRSVQGRMSVRFTILETGDVSEVSAEEGTLASPQVANCVLRLMKTWRTPFRPSAPVSVEYPLVFTTKDG